MSLRVLLLCLAMFAAIPAAWARDEAERPPFVPPPPPTPPGWDADIQGFAHRIPYDVERARQDLMERGDAESARSRIMAFVLRTNQRGVEKVRDKVRAEGWDVRFQGLYDATVAHVNELYAGDPRRFYDLALDYGRRAGLNGNPYSWETEGRPLAVAAKALFMEARVKQVPEALILVAEVKLRSHDAADRRHGLALLRRAGELAHPPAIFELIKIYRDGQVVHADLRSEYFWLLRAAEAGLEVRQRMSDVERLLPSDVRERVQRMESAPYP